ncbi:nucleotidyl transferase AbiEii/AbiGii toxin family protein [Nocardia sp. NBC_00565]|uniref:nucleotidyl transferase AbiEii/AbiGii toxin family protein n=1 Tax=Nocardia sp. NBC_00565 TaxID=2975993 RepID=UPI002E8068AD|nr:nucleotidyl transferase AbiEii/AbiGii toxin family protein [Nocardia sp. NBC_00565]WUB99901.1 nucleotidyl transferase AbiEii/AbiGii toxin family protein [Nocardia sp. NBC_00565]
MSLEYHERASIAAQFGVSDMQVERDYLISLLLAYLSENHSDSVVFIGGTALARTHLPNGRLSEDIDLVSVESRTELASQLTRALPRAVQRSYGRLEWQPSLADVSGSDAAHLVAADGRAAVKIQLLSHAGMAPWPTESRALEQRYRDVPAATLTVPTRAAFVAAKTVAWCDRAAARDLWDLWALSRMGAFDHEAAALFRRFGPTNKQPQPSQFSRAPTEDQWQAQLSGQTRVETTAAEALRIVRAAWLSATP